MIDAIATQRQADPEPFHVLVRRMRQAQTFYFQTRTQDALINARRLEKQVDTYLRNLSMGDPS